jgi:hypothetical protein
MKMLHSLERKGHCVVINNYFSSIPLFQNLIQKCINAIGMVGFNHIELPSHLKNTKAWMWCKQGHIEYTMHNSKDISFVMWKDKCPTLLISTHANIIGFPCMPCDKVLRKNGTVRKICLHHPCFLSTLHT